MIAVVVVLAVALLARAARAWRRPGVVVAVLVLAAVVGAHLAAVLLFAVVTVIGVALAVLVFAIAGVVVESGWGVVPYQPLPRRSGERS